MLPAFQFLINAVWRARITHFWPIWMGITLAALAGAAWLLGNGTRPSSRHVVSSPQSSRTAIRLVSPLGVAGWSALIVFLALYIATIVTWEDFTWYDNSSFTTGSLVGQNIPPPIRPEQGRFFPLAYQEFNLVRHWTRTAIGYHVLPIFELVGFTALLLALTSDLGIGASLGITITALIAPAILTGFAGLIYPERNVLLCLAGFVWSVRRFEQRGSRGWALLSLLWAQIMLYEKETACLLLFAFGVSRIILRYRMAGGQSSPPEVVREPLTKLDLTFAGLALLFVAYYVATILPHPNLGYARWEPLPLWPLIRTYLKVDVLAAVFAGTLVVRTWFILRGKVAPLLLWDGVAYGAFAYLSGFIYLHMYSPYYLAPVDMVALLYLGRLATLSWNRMSLTARAIAVSVLLSVVLQQSVFSAFHLLERKNVIHSKAAIAGVIRSRYRGSGIQRMFFPFASPYVISEFAAYLDYIGVPIERVDHEADGAVVRIAAAQVATNGQCFGGSTFVCHPAHAPSAGDLVIVMPDDDASLVDASKYSTRGELLFSYDPYPHAPNRFYRELGPLHVASQIFSRIRLPDHWLRASVTLLRSPETQNHLPKLHAKAFP